MYHDKPMANLPHPASKRKFENLIFSEMKYGIDFL
jgi:hypothetical protein